MAQRSHVPKFGNWDSDNVPYTTYFENARKEKASGVRMNPNDPVENPAAFMCIEESLESGGGGRAPRPPHHVSSNKAMHVEDHYIKGHTRRNAHRRPPSDQYSGSRKSITSESGSDKTSSDYSLLQGNHRRLRSDRQKTPVESSNSFSPSLAGSTKQKSVNRPHNDPHHKAASVPKFGEWDEKDPKSGEGFTVIFNKVKEEKQIATTTFPVVPPQPSNYSNSQKKHGSCSLRSKICCCFCCGGSK